MITELKHEMGVDGQARWRDQNRDAFQVLIVRKQAELERESNDCATVFLDRGRLDGVAYCQLFDMDPPQEVVERCQGENYGRVFVLDTLSDFTTRIASGRTSGRERSLEIRSDPDHPLQRLRPAPA